MTCTRGHLEGLALLACCAVSGAPVAAQTAADDLVPAAIDALLATPDDLFVYGIPFLATGTVVISDNATGSARCLADVGDVTGDGAPDFATGFAPGGQPATLVVRDGRSGTLVWSAAPDDGGFRSLRALDVRDGRLVAGVASAHGRVDVRDVATGAVLWSRDLQPSAALPANVLAVRFLDDIDGDSQPDVLAAGGRGIDALLLMSGADGQTLWTHAAGDVVYDACPVPDQDGDGTAEIALCGGDDQPFFSMLSGSDGHVLWNVPLSGPGSALLPLGDIDGDGVNDLAAGVFAQPQTCLFALSGSSGATLWESLYCIDNVTSMAAVSDLDGDGLAEFAIGSFDNAMSTVQAGNGLFAWRREGSSVNGGSMLSVVNAGDVDGNGVQDLYSSSLDKQIYVADGLNGYFLTVHELRHRGVAMLALGDGDGDGRREIVAAGNGGLRVLAGSSGIAAGPVVYLDAPEFLSGEIKIYAFAYPGKILVVLGATAPGSIKLPAFTGSFGLSPASFAVLFVGPAPAAGLSGYLVEPLPREAVGLTIYFQVVSLSAAGGGAFSNVPSFKVPG